MANIALGVMALLGFMGYRRGFTASAIRIVSYIIGGIAALMFCNEPTLYILDFLTPRIINFLTSSVEIQETFSFDFINVTSEQINLILYPIIGTIISFLIFRIVSSLSKTLLNATSINEVINSIPMIGVINKSLGAACYLLVPIIFLYFVLTNKQLPFHYIESGLSNLKNMFSINY